MNELNFDDICLLAERIQEAVREIQDNGVLFDPGHRQGGACPPRSRPRLHPHNRPSG